ncbi:DUF1232 domain-containing protein [candidate division WOR-3 bacterium]|nr:DUF1232 domain-containing protein [candidate division WOR-3 bacterium]
MTDEQVKQEVDRTIAYIVRAPILLQVMVEVAQTAGIGNWVVPIAEEAARYFTNPADVIPDSQGLFGLMDDAYYAQTFVEAVSNTVRKQYGSPLLAFSLAPDNACVRSLLGDYYARPLDQAVKQRLSGQVLLGWLAQAARVMTVLGAFQTSVTDQRINEDVDRNVALITTSV